MRDLLIFSIVGWLLAKSFSRPYMGVYAWTWISLMNPHRLAWGVAYDFPFALVIAGATSISLMTGKQTKLPIWSRESVVLLLYVIWVCVTTLFAVNPPGAMRELDRFLKIQLFVFLTLWLMSDREKLNGFIWVMVLSIGYYGVKGGIFTILTGGGSRVWGPEGSFVGGNNEIGLALLITVPLMRYLQLQAKNPWIERGLAVSMLLSAIAILGTQSRGAFLGIMAIGFFFWLKTRHKLGATLLVGMVGVVVLTFMPDSWWTRMDTIKTYNEDASAMGRINAWTVAWRIAGDRITGGGANLFTPAIFQQYAPDPYDVHDVHSIYFEVLGEQGYPGLALWLSLGIMTWLRCSAIIKHGKNNPSHKWAVDLASMVQVSLIGYATAGAFLGLSYFDFYYDLIAVILITWRLISAPQRLEESQAKESSGH